jgi:PAS domain-containing protein
MTDSADLLAGLPPAAMLDALPFAVIATDLDGTIFHWNPAAELMYGFGRDRLLGANVGEVLVPVDVQDQGMEIMATVLARERLVRCLPGAASRRVDCPAARDRRAAARR